MLRIGLITFHRASNFGAALQTYATQQLLERENPGSRVTVLDFVPPFMAIRAPRWKPRKRAQRKCFLDFVSEHLRLSPVSSERMLDCVPEGGLDAVVAGSDQIWNPGITKEHWREYFLAGFPENLPRYSFSSSFGVGLQETLCSPKTTAEIATLLKSFRRIAVRERSGLERCRQLGRPDAIHTLDPVLVAGAEFFLPLLPQTDSSPEPMCTAVLLDETREHREMLLVLRKATGKPCQLIAVKQRIFPTPGIHRPFRTAIPEWLQAIRQAPMIISDSYHATLFAILFHRPFAVVPSRKNNRFERLADILELLGLSDRIVIAGDCAGLLALLQKPIDYGRVDAILEPLRKTSLSALRLD